MNRNVLKKIKEWEYPNNTRGKTMPKINSINGNALNKHKEEDARKRIMKGQCPEYTQVIRRTLQQTHRMAS